MGLNGTADFDVTYNIKKVRSHWKQHGVFPHLFYRRKEGFITSHKKFGAFKIKYKSPFKFFVLVNSFQYDIQIEKTF